MNRRERDAAKRSAYFEAAVAEAQAALDDMRRPRVAEQEERAERPDVAALVARELDRRTAAAEAADADRFRCPTGACCYCGLGAVRTPSADGGFAPAWHSDPRGHRCGLCDGELFSRIADTDADRRVRVALRLLGLEHSIPLLALGNPQLFADIRLWWFEHPGARPVFDLDQRFAHVDRDRLRADFEAVLHPTPPANTWPRRKGARCGTCHTSTKLIETVTRAGGGPPSEEDAAGPWRRDGDVYTWEVEHCAECLRRWFAAAGSPPEALAALA